MIYIHMAASKHAKNRFHQNLQSHSLQKTVAHLCIVNNMAEDINRARSEISEEVGHIHRS